MSSLRQHPGNLEQVSQYYVLDSMTVIVVQAFFAIRAWKVANRNWIVLGLITAFALTAFGGGIGVKVVFMQVGSTLRAGDVKVPAYIWLFSTMAADLIITSIILYYLITSRKTTGQKATDDVITRLARVTFESQLPPTLIAIGLAIEYTIQGVDLGDDDESRTSRSRDLEAGVRKTSDIDLGENGISVVDLDDVNTPPRRAGRGGEFKLASMGLGGGMSSLDTGR
ncbi:hypothetical protein FRC11_009087 [Ceratobasidium sp. 423]|nr:hypothetical protein FRC11_009087 [Ceratobasidium sp. 423]